MKSSAIDGGSSFRTLSTRFVCWVLIWSVCILRASTILAADDPLWYSGAASEVITPSEPMWMAGYGGRTEPASGKLSDLFAKALVLRAGDDQPALVLTLDLVGIDRLLSDKIKASIAAQLPIKPERMVICTSHTHSGPVVGLNLGPMHFYRLSKSEQTKVDTYATVLVDKCVQVAKSAHSRLASCKLEWGTGSCDFAVNRRTNKEADVPNLRFEHLLAGPSDHDVPVLVSRDKDGKVSSILFGYACHATVLSGQSWCADYPGYAQTELERLYPGAVALFFAGCGADQNPLPRRTPQLAEHYGRRLANAVEAVLLTSKMQPAAVKLECSIRDIDLPLAEIPTLEQWKKLETSTNVFEASRASLLVRQIESGKPLSQTYKYPISIWSIGGAVNFVTLGGEVVVDYSLRIKSELTNPTWVAGYSNDVMAYIPSRRVLTEGGYEGGGSMVYYGLPAFWAPEVEERILSAVHELVRGMRRE